MSNFTLTKNLRAIEWLKAELVDNLGTLFKGLAKNNSELVLNSLASLVISGYFLGKRLGVSYQKLDNAITNRLVATQVQGYEIEECVDEAVALEQFWQRK